MDTDDEVDSFVIGGPDWMDSVVLTNCKRWGIEWDADGRVIKHYHDRLNPDTGEWEPVRKRRRAKLRRE